MVQLGICLLMVRYIGLLWKALQELIYTFTMIVCVIKEKPWKTSRFVP